MTRMPKRLRCRGAEGTGSCAVRSPAPARTSKSAECIAQKTAGDVPPGLVPSICQIGMAKLLKL